MRKIIKRILLGFLLLIFICLTGLLANNLILRAVYSRYVTDADTLSKDELTQVKEVYDYLEAEGTKLLPGFDGKNIDLIVFNHAYEFLICNGDADNNWEFLEENEALGKNIYRRNADNSQAFAVNTNGEWVGSMSTRKNFVKSITNTLGEAGVFGYLIPLQVFATDNEHYKGLIIHEMTHALQAIQIEPRLIKDQTISNVSSKYDNNTRYQELIREEAKYIEKALKSESLDETTVYAKHFLVLRKQRREESNMTSQEIRTEKEFEWLEGLARYTEYVSSAKSKSILRGNLDNIENKMNEGGDERFYALGMAQALVLDKLGYDWKQTVFTENFTFEDTLEQALTK
ncbi:MAG TPA: hypothetical protein VN131_03550 [Mobilitalea sp.]|nr:hypothetical protein [Mobilitalea sp.]